MTLEARSARFTCPYPENAVPGIAGAVAHGGRLVGFGAAAQPARERIVIIPRGTGTAAIPTFPSRINLMVGVQDTLVLQNDDDRSQLVAGIEVGRSLNGILSLERAGTSIPRPAATDRHRSAGRACLGRRPSS